MDKLQVGVGPTVLVYLAFSYKHCTTYYTAVHAICTCFLHKY
jgi:hypothetical protein